MSNGTFQDDPAGPMDREEMQSALFANLVMQQANTALVFLGRAPHPESGGPVVDLETAQFFIDTLEMLQAKTKGNLDAREDGLLKQSLVQLRMAFVEAAGHPPPPAAAAEDRSAPRPEPAPSASASGPAPATPAPEAPSAEPSVRPGAPAEEVESRKKFTKKY